MGAQDLFVLFFASSYESLIISKWEIKKRDHDGGREERE